MTEQYDKKINQLQGGQTPRVLDLFSGCGGLSLGFQDAGFDIVGGIEIDKHAAKSYGTNFHAAEETHCQARDITDLHNTTPEILATEFDLGPVPQAIDIIIGGPPCQSFARIGRPKLRDVAARPQAFLEDPRSQLYLQYLRFIEAFNPLAVLMENVPDALNHGGQNIAQELCDVLSSKGYVCGYTLLNAAFYGVPQMRERMFLIALRQELDQAVTFPEPTYWADLPSGYRDLRASALKTIQTGENATSYQSPPIATNTLPPAITAHEAIGDLPPIYAREALEDGTLTKGIRQFKTSIPYDQTKAVSPYAQSMKAWLGFEAPKDGIRDHVIRYLPRDYDIFARMNPGDQYPDSHRHALQIFEETLDHKSPKPTEDSEEWLTLRKKIVPPYDVTKFPNKWRKMWSDKPARTLLAHLGKDGYSHIHYDSNQARTISVREAARLQSFPDGFVFCNNMNPAFKQIGNAAPPLLAKAIALHLKKALFGADE